MGEVLFHVCRQSDINCVALWVFPTFLLLLNILLLGIPASKFTLEHKCVVAFRLNEDQMAFTYVPHALKIRYICLDLPASCGLRSLYFCY